MRSTTRNVLFYLINPQISSRETSKRDDNVGIDKKFKIKFWKIAFE